MIAYQSLKPHRQRQFVDLRKGRSIADLVMCMAIFGIVAAMLTTQLQRDRELARDTACRNNLRNIGLAIIGYHRTFEQLPRHGTGTHDERSADADDGDAGPEGSGGTGGGNSGKSLSFLVAILPQLDQQALWETISTTSTRTVRGKLAAGGVWNPMGPSPSQRHYPPWVTDLDLLRCPSDQRTDQRTDQGKGQEPSAPITGRTNYAACLGDSVDFQMDSAVRFDQSSKRWKLDRIARQRVNASARGAFVYREDQRLSDITDGLSQTILIGEIATHLGDLDRRTAPALNQGDQDSGIPPKGGIFDSARSADQHINVLSPRLWIEKPARFGGPPTLPTRADEYRGLRWADGHTVFTGVTTISPPNSSLQVEGDSVTGSAIAPPSSHHPGGAHVLLADGSTQFISDAIDCGDLYQGSVRFGMTGPLAPGSKSPYGTWGAMGTRAAKD